MALKDVKLFFSILNIDALLFLSTRLAGIVFSIASVIILCRAATLQQYFMTDGQGHLYDLLPLGPLAYSLAWSVISLILPGCQRKYHPVLDMVFDFLGWAFSFVAGGALLRWSIVDGYEFDNCTTPTSEAMCETIEGSIRTAEHAGAFLLILGGITHVIMFVRATIAVNVRRKKYVPSRNSFMQLGKSVDYRPSATTSDLNTQHLVNSKREQEKSGRQSKKLSANSSVDGV